MAMKPEYAKSKLYTAIRNKCLDCSGGYRDEVTNCTVKDCALYEYRFGKNSQNKKE